MLANKANHLVSLVTHRAWRCRPLPDRNILSPEGDIKLNSHFGSKFVRPLISCVSHCIPVSSSGFPKVFFTALPLLHPASCATPEQKKGTYVLLQKRVGSWRILVQGVLECFVCICSFNPHEAQ